MKKGTPSLGKEIEIYAARIRDHLWKLVRGSVEETLNTLLDAEADPPCNSAPTNGQNYNAIRSRLV